MKRRKSQQPEHDSPHEQRLREIVDVLVPSESGTDVGTSDVIQVGTAVLTLSRGTGPAQHTYWTGYWTAAGA